MDHQTLSKPIRQSEPHNSLGLTMVYMTRAFPSKRTNPTPLGDVEQPLKAYVLLVEDNPVNQLVCQEMLEELGYRTDVAQDGLGAVEMVATGAYDLVLMDLQMPVMDGFVATERIREFERTENTPRPIPVIALTAHAIEGDRQRCLDAGMCDYLSKPFTLAQLREVLENWLVQGEPLIQSKGPASGPEGGSVKDDTAELDAGYSLLDKKALDNIRALQRMDAPNVLDKVIKIFLENSPKLVGALRDAIAQNDAAGTIEQAAHSLKSSSATLGATRLAALCRELERMARENRISGAKAILSEIEKLYPSVCERLAAECESEVG